jgi:RNA polymerase sigma-70 factor, ECF subfamily
MSGGKGHVAAGVGLDFVARIAAGDRAAEAEFVRRYEGGVRVLMRRHCRLGDPIVADLAQEVLMHVIERMRAGAVNDANALPGYVRSTVVRTASAEYRRRHDAVAGAVMEDIAGHDNPVERHAASQLASALKALLSQMPVVRDREILSRFYLRDEDRDAVCRALGIEPDHFHRVVHRARVRFRMLLEQAGISGTTR